MLLIVFTFVALLPAAAALSDTQAVQNKRELRELREEIAQLQRSLEANRDRKTRAERRVQAVDRKIAEAARDLRKLDNSIAANQRELRELADDRQRLQKQLHDQRQRLAEEARTAYAMGRQQTVKLLLNQEDPAGIGRMMGYFRYFSQARLTQIESVQETVRELEQIRERADARSRELGELRDRHAAQAEALHEQKRKRERTLLALSDELREQGSRLRRLQDDEAELRELVESLRELLSDIPADAGDDRPFAARKGALHWPAEGLLARKFGASRGAGLKWRGVMISGREGSQVHAVAEGRVAFADWMRGFGLLLIIDHGDGYMSLYGHNQALYKEVGEWVDSREVVATLGASGGQSTAGLYFELRHDGRPVDPAKWCAGLPAGAS